MCIGTTSTSETHRIAWGKPLSAELEHRLECLDGRILMKNPADCSACRLTPIAHGISLWIQPEVAGKKIATPDIP
jgi:hypothetical protein